MRSEDPPFRGIVIHLFLRYRYSRPDVVTGKIIIRSWERSVYCPALL